MNHGQFLKEVGLKVRAVPRARKMPITEVSKLCGRNLTQLSFSVVLQLDLKELF
jgi:hypothetical protein